MSKIEYDGIIYDSQEELDFKHWLDEALDAGLIEGFKKCEKGKDTYELIGKQYYYKGDKQKHCFASVDYTPDFLVKSHKFKPFTEKDIDFEYHTIDVKGGFSQHNDQKQFQIIRKMMYRFKGIYIHKVVPEKLFLETWLPAKAGRTKVKGDIQKKYEGCLTISEFKERV